MRISYHRKFIKQFQKFPSSIQTSVTNTLEIFAKNPFTPSLKNHALSGKMQFKRAFSVARDIRIIYQEIDGHAWVILLDIGTHNQVYR